MIRSGTINMIRENVRKGKSAYAVGKELAYQRTQQRSICISQKQNMG